MPNYKGNGRLDGIFSRSLTLSDTTMPTLAVQWSNFPIAGEKQNVVRTRGTITIEPTGATSKLKITLTVERDDFVGDALADLTWVISAGAARTEWTSTTASGTATAATLYDVIKLINDLPDFKAWALHAPHSLSVNSDNFIALAETDLLPGGGPGGYSKVLYRDASEYSDVYLRLGLPELRDLNAICLLDVAGTCTGVTNGTLEILRDDYSEYGNTVAAYLRKVLAASSSGYFDKDMENAYTLAGPVLVKASSDDLTAADLIVTFKQASIG